MTRTAFEISWLGLVAIAVLLYVIVSGVANPRTRPIVLGLGASIGLAIFLLVGVFHVVSKPLEPPPPRMIATKEVTPRMIVVPPAPPVPSSPQSPATETNRPKTPLIIALRDALLQAWTVRSLPPTAAAPAKPAKASQADVRTLSEPPAWVNAAPQMEGDDYRMSVHSGPYTTPLECMRELPKALQSALAEYADLSLGSEAARVHLSDDALQEFIQERWTESRPMEIDGASQDMVTLHALVVFDGRTKQLLKAGAERLMIDKRVQGAGVVFGGVLGLLALTWGGLKLATKRQEQVKS